MLLHAHKIVVPNWSTLAVCADPDAEPVGVEMINGDVAGDVFGTGADVVAGVLGVCGEPAIVAAIGVDGIDAAFGLAGSARITDDAVWVLAADLLTSSLSG